MRDTGLSVPLSSGKINACFSCYHVIDTVIRYKEMIQSSEIGSASVRPFQNLTKSINNAKQSSVTPRKTVQNRKKALPVKLQPPIRECVVKMTRLDFSSLNEALWCGSPPANSTSETPTKHKRKPVKLQKGNPWTNSGLKNCLSPPSRPPKDVKRKRKALLSLDALFNGVKPGANRVSTDFKRLREARLSLDAALNGVKRTKERRLSLGVTESVLVESDKEGGCETVVTNGRVIRKRKLTKHQDFLYFSDKESVQEFNVATKSKAVAARAQKPSKSPSPPKVNYSELMKPCVVRLKRLEFFRTTEPETTDTTSIQPAEEENDIHIIIDDDSTATTIEAPPALQEQQNENSPPNIPQMISVQYETPTKCTPEITEIFSSSSSSVLSASAFLTDEETLTASAGPTPIKSILSPDRYRRRNSASKSVSFSEHCELFLYEPEKGTTSSPDNHLSSSNHILEVEDLDDSFSTHDERQQEEVHTFIDEIISQSFDETCVQNGN